MHESNSVFFFLIPKNCEIYSKCCINMHLLHTSLQYCTLSNITPVPRRVSMDLPKDCRQAWMISSQLAPLVRWPRDIMDLAGAVWAGLGLWNLWGRPGGETLGLELHPGVTLLEKHQQKKEGGDRRAYCNKSVLFSICIWGCWVCVSTCVTNHHLMRPQIITHENGLCNCHKNGGIV